jgi:hypothetical protein
MCWSDGGLKLQQQHQVAVPAIGPRDTPDHVALTALPAVSVELGVQPLHPIEVQIGQPASIGKLPQQLRHHAWVAE